MRGRRPGSAFWWVLLALPVGGCYVDRSRPGPSEPEITGSLSVQVIEPRHGISVLGARPLAVRIQGRDLGGARLEGVGFVARRSGSGAATLDSAAFRPGAAGVLDHEFEFTVPDLPTNTQVDVYGVAYGPGTQARLSVASSVVVVRCQPGIPGC